MFVCTTPTYNTTVPSHGLQLQLLIHLGAGDDILNGSTNHRKPFSIFADPTVTQWDSVQPFKVYLNEKYISIGVGKLDNLSRGLG